MTVPKRIGILISGTSRCNTGCSHCLCESSPKGEDLALSKIKDLKKSVEKYPGRVCLSFSGGGEPLLWQHLPEAIATLARVKNADISLVTSGCLGRNDERFAVLEQVTKLKESIFKKVKFNLSFNLYGASLPKRLGFTLPFVLEKTKQPIVAVKTTVHPSSADGKEIIKTRQMLEEVMKRVLGSSPAVVTPSHLIDEKDWLWILDYFLRRVAIKYSVIDQIMERHAFTGDTFYLPFRYPSKVIIAAFHYTKLAGRAEKFRPNRGNISPVFSCRHGLKQLELTFGPSGDFPFCNLSGFPPISLGSAGDNIQTVIRRGRKVLKELNLLSLLLGPEEFFDICDVCRKKANRLYGDSHNLIQI